jgi:hypothetical protein
MPKPSPDVRRDRLLTLLDWAAFLLIAVGFVVGAIWLMIE